MNVKQVIADWNAGMSRGKIMRKHKLGFEQEYAIIFSSSSLSIAQIEERLKNVRPGMDAVEIEAVMEEKPCTNS